MKTLLPILDNIERVVRPRMIVVKSLNYSKLLIQLLKGYQVKATQGAKMALDNNCNGSDSQAEGRLIQIDNLAQATRHYLEHCQIQYTRLISSPCPFPRTWGGEKSSNRRAELCHMSQNQIFAVSFLPLSNLAVSLFLSSYRLGYRFKTRFGWSGSRTRYKTPNEWGNIKKNVKINHADIQKFFFYAHHF